MMKSIIFLCAFFPLFCVAAPWHIVFINKTQHGVSFYSNEAYKCMHDAGPDTIKLRPGEAKMISYNDSSNILHTCSTRAKHVSYEIDSDGRLANIQVEHFKSIDSHVHTVWKSILKVSELAPNNRIAAYCGKQTPSFWCVNRNVVSSYVHTIIVCGPHC